MASVTNRERLGCYAREQTDHTARLYSPLEGDPKWKEGHLSRICPSQKQPRRIRDCEGLVMSHNNRRYDDIATSVARKLGFIYHRTALSTLIGYSQEQTVSLLVRHPYTKYSDVVDVSRTGGLRITTVPGKDPLTHPIRHTNAVRTPRHDTSRNTRPLPRTHYNHRRTVHSTCSVCHGPPTVINWVINPSDVITRADDCEEKSTTREVNIEPIMEDQIDTDLKGEEKLSPLKALDDNRVLVEHNIQLYLLTYYERQQLENIIADLKISDVVKDCDSPFGNSVLLVRKTNRKIRLCVEIEPNSKDKAIFVTSDGYYRFE
ncbi:hypothetical protein HZH68_001163 [Vespula germanica]|uniref:Uncharacterized protein n=1 Tax=Vespula germanica TaxID=30212 RepID=A0A834NUX8_VESGE|nr:hypothetical protein HZH68_001163 [Vespula germanica]